MYMTHMSFEHCRHIRHIKHEGGYIMLDYSNCTSIVDMARLVYENQDEESHYIDQRTTNIVKNEFPLFLETARAFLKDDFSKILSSEEEEKAIGALANIITNALNNVHTANAYADDTILLIMTAALMIDRAENMQNN